MLSCYEREEYAERIFDTKFWFIRVKHKITKVATVKEYREISGNLMSQGKTRKRRGKWRKFHGKIIKSLSFVFSSGYDISNNNFCLKTISNYAFLTIWCLFNCQEISPKCVREPSVRWSRRMLRQESSYQCCSKRVSKHRIVWLTSQPACGAVALWKSSRFIPRFVTRVPLLICFQLLTLTSFCASKSFHADEFSFM